MKGLYLHLPLTLALASCTVGPKYQVPEIELPTKWHSQDPNGESACVDNDVWWERLKDPTLEMLISHAAEQNLDLHIAATRLQQARLEAKAKKADNYPHIDGSLAAGHLYYSKDALVNGLLSKACRLKRHGVRRHVDFFEAGFDFDWELDFFGYNAHEIAAARAHEQAVQEDLCSIWVTLSAEVARNYFELRGLQEKQKIAKAHIDIQKQSIELTKELLERGVVNESDLSLARGELSALEGALPLLELAARQATHRLSILLGLAPAELYECLSVPQPLPEVPLECAAGVPSELLRRRPDIRKAERELAAATERIGSAIAALYPRFSLRGFVGDVSTRVGSLFSPASFTWLAGPQILVPIFNSRLLLQDVAYNKVSTQQAIYVYQKSIIEALEEAENAISAYQMQEKHYQHLKNAYQHNSNALRFAKDLYERGLQDTFSVIKARLPFLKAEEALVESQVDLLTSYVSLYKALGGCW